MENNLERLESLARLSREASDEGRQELLRKVTDMFLEAPQNLGDTEKEYFGEIMGKLAFKLEMKVRQHLSETLSEVGDAPRDLVVKLANDEIGVARPVLTKSDVLQDEDLLEIVKQSGQGHLMAVSGRQVVSELVSDAIVEKGNDAVLGTLASNAGAELSSQAKETMVARSEDGDEALQEALVNRQDLPPDLMKKMHDHVSDALRETIMAGGTDVGESEIDQLLNDAGDWLKGSGGGGEMSAAEKFIIRKEKLKQLKPSLLIKLMRDGKVAEFTVGIARLVRIDLATAGQALTDKSGEKLAVICKALDFDAEMFSQLVNMSEVHGKLDDEDKKILVGVYGRITTETAQRAMRFLRTRQKLKKADSKMMKWGQ